MGTLTKVFVILNLVFSIAFVMVSATVLSQRSHWKQRYLDEVSQHAANRKALQDEIADHKKYERQLIRERDDLKNTVADLGEKRNELEELAKQKDREIRELKSEKATKDTRIAELLRENTRLNQLYTKTVEERNAKIAELQKADKKVEELQSLVIGLQAEIAARNLKVDELLKTIEVRDSEIAWRKTALEYVRAENPELVTRAEDFARGEKGSVPPAPIDAVVKAVDMDIGVVILNVGSKSKVPVKEGYRFLIHRRGRFLRAVQVKTVAPDMCSAVFIEPSTGEAVQVGDRAMTQF